MRSLAALAIVVAGAVGAFAVYTFGWRDDPETPNHHVFTVRSGDVVHVPQAATTCMVTHEAGIPNFFCKGTPRSRYTVVIWNDQADLYDLEAGGEPMAPTYSVPRTPSR